MTTTERYLGGSCLQLTIYNAQFHRCWRVTTIERYRGASLLFCNAPLGLGALWMTLLPPAAPEVIPMGRLKSIIL